VDSLINMDSLIEYSSAKKYKKGTAIIEEGAESPYSFYIILSGSVRVVKNYSKYDQTVVAVLSSGDFFGEMSLFMKKPRTATIVTAEDTVVLEITQDNVYEVMKLNPHIFCSIIETLCKRIDDLNGRVRSLGNR